VTADTYIGFGQIGLKSDQRRLVPSGIGGEENSEDSTGALKEFYLLLVYILFDYEEYFLLGKTPFGLV